MVRFDKRLLRVGMRRMRGQSRGFCLEMKGGERMKRRQWRNVKERVEERGGQVLLLPPCFASEEGQRTGLLQCQTPLQVGANLFPERGRRRRL